MRVVDAGTVPGKQYAHSLRRGRIREGFAFMHSSGDIAALLGRAPLPLDRLPARRLGQPPLLFTDYKAPAADALDVSLWIIQRDERLGVHAYEACLRVTP
jgi:hypothetical protein